MHRFFGLAPDWGRHKMADSARPFRETLGLNMRVECDLR